MHLKSWHNVLPLPLPERSTSTHERFVPAVKARKPLAAFVVFGQPIENRSPVLGTNYLNFE